MMCRHPHGASIPDVAPWVCGVCYALLDERPRRYGPGKPPLVKGGEQAIVWQAAIRIAQSGLDLAAFVSEAARYLCDHSTVTRAQAAREIIGYLQLVGSEFSDPDLRWDADAAKTLAREIMQDWESHAEGN